MSDNTIGYLRFAQGRNPYIRRTSGICQGTGQSPLGHKSRGKLTTLKEEDMIVSVGGCNGHLERDISRARWFDQQAQGDAGDLNRRRECNANGSQNRAKVLVVGVDSTAKVFALDGNLGRHDDGHVEEPHGGGTHVLTNAKRVRRHRERKNGHISRAWGAVGPWRLLGRCYSKERDLLQSNAS